LFGYKALIRVLDVFKIFLLPSHLLMQVTSGGRALVNAAPFPKSKLHHNSKLCHYTNNVD
jgi:hypothetical protein